MDKPYQPFTDGLPNLSEGHFAVPTPAHLHVAQPFTHAPRFLILYGSLRERSFSRFLADEVARLLEAMRTVCPCPMTAPQTTRRCRRYGSSRSGPRAMCGCRPSGTAT